MIEMKKELLFSSLLLLTVLSTSAAPAAPFFADATELNFPAPACVAEPDPEDPDLGARRLGCYTNFLVLSDIDGDADLDILMANGGGYYVRDVAEESSLYLNDGNGSFSNATSALLGGVTSRLRQVAIADVDGDGDRDIYLPGGYGADADRLFIQTAPAVFADEADARLPPFTWSNAGAAHFGDLDNDGDVDLVVSDWGAAPRSSPGNTLLYLNDGSGVFSALEGDEIPPPIDPAEGLTPIDVDLADIDGDFDLDILVNHRNGQSRIFLNDGKAKFSDATAGNYPEKKGPYVYNVEACDYDEDGDLDLLLDNAGGTQEDPFGNISQVLNNDGSGSFSDVTAETITGEPFADDNAVKCADVDGDGHYDLIVASLTNPAEKLLLNDGSATFTYQDAAFPDVVIDDGVAGPEGNFPGDPSLGIDVADLDGDGMLDVVTGQGEFGYFGVLRSHLDRIYLGSGSSSADTTPPKFRGIEQPVAVSGEPIVVRFAVTDAHTSETGEHVGSVTLSYTLADGGEEETVPAIFMGGDLFRAVIPAQPAGSTVTFAVSATDRVGESASSEPLSVTIPEELPGMGGADAGGAAGSETAPSAAGEVGVGGNGAAGKPSSAAGEGGEPAARAGTDEDDGCGCSVPGTAPGRNGALLAALAGALLLRRRRLGSGR
jgi:MYXO-CTERM domain-containing protein